MWRLRYVMPCFVAAPSSTLCRIKIQCNKCPCAKSCTVQKYKYSADLSISFLGTYTLRYRPQNQLLQFIKTHVHCKIYPLLTFTSCCLCTVYIHPSMTFTLAIIYTHLWHSPLPYTHVRTPTYDIDLLLFTDPLEADPGSFIAEKMCTRARLHAVLRPHLPSLLLLPLSPAVKGTGSQVLWSMLYWTLKPHLPSLFLLPLSPAARLYCTLQGEVHKDSAPCCTRPSPSLPSPLPAHYCS
jgi:hypothetical protein